MRWDQDPESDGTWINEVRIIGWSKMGLDLREEESNQAEEG